MQRTTQEKRIQQDERYMCAIKNINRFRSIPFSALRIYTGNAVGLLRFFFPQTLAETIINYAAEDAELPSDADLTKPDSLKTPRMSDLEQRDSRIAAMAALHSDIQQSDVKLYAFLSHNWDESAFDDWLETGVLPTGMTSYIQLLGQQL